MTGTRASFEMRSTRLLPPRGTITSTYSSRGDELAHGGAVGGADELDRGLRQPRGLEARVQARGDGLVGVERLAAAAQDGRVAALQAQAARVGGHVRARLVDDAHHAQRHAHAPHLDAGGAEAQVRDLAHRVRQLRDLAQALGHFLDHLGGELEAVDEGVVGAVGARALHVLRVGGEDRLLAVDERLGGDLEGAVLGGGAGARERPRRPRGRPGPAWRRMTALRRRCSGRSWVPASRGLRRRGAGPACRRARG